MASAPKRAHGCEVPLESLRIADLAGVTDAVIAEQHGVSTRTVKRRRKAARERYPRWPHVVLEPEAPTAKRPALEPDALPPLPETPDELEELAGRILLSAAMLGGHGAEARGANAMRLLEFADRLRKRGAGAADRDPLEVKAEVARVIELAVANVRPPDPA